MIATQDPARFVMHKCLTPGCEIKIDSRFIFCGACRLIAGKEARIAWEFAFPYPRAYAYAMRDPAQRQAIDNFEEAVKIARSQMSLFPSWPYEGFTK